MTPEDFLKARAADIGFDICRITRVDEDWPAGAHLEDFIRADHHGTMTWMATTLERRKHPRAMWPDAKSAILLGLNYGPDDDPLSLLERRDRGAISVYARGRDYHKLIKQRLKQLARAYAEKTHAAVRVFVDTAPLMEKPLAAKAGLGWQGKHTNLVSRSLGNWLFLGVILTDAELVADAEEHDHCGSCHACLDICPTQAFPAPYRLDARKCISYLTIEHKGPIPSEYRRAMGNRIYGCDDCLAVCPWNKFAETAREASLHARAELKMPKLADLAALDETGFREVFAGSPVRRAGHESFIRNVAIAIGNSGEAALVSSLVALLADESEVIRGAAIWGLSRLDSAVFAAEKAHRAADEHDATVIAEWEQDHVCQLS